RLLPVDYIGHEPSLLSSALPSDDQGDPIVRCLLSRPSTIADLIQVRFEGANSVARCVGRRNCCLSSLSCLFAEWMQGVSVGGRPPSTLLFESTDTKLGDESELFRDLED